MTWQILPDRNIADCGGAGGDGGRIPTHAKHGAHALESAQSSRRLQREVDAISDGPGLMAGITLLWRFLPWLSPRNFEVDSFRSTYFQIMLIMVSLLAYFNAVVLWAGVGYTLNVGRAIVGGLCLFFALLGNLLGKVRRNFYIGVRTPWALANERVWNATHRFAAKTFVAGGLVGLALTAVGLQGRAVFVVLLAAALIPAVYSLAFYKQLERRGEL